MAKDLTKKNQPKKRPYSTQPNTSGTHSNDEFSDSENEGPNNKNPKTPNPNLPSSISLNTQTTSKPPTEVSFEELGINEENLIINTVGSMKSFNNANQEADYFKGIQANRNIDALPNPISSNNTMTERPSTSSSVAPNAPVTFSPDPTKGIHNLEDEQRKVLKAELKNAFKLIGIPIKEADGILNQTNNDQLHGFVEGLKFCFNHSFRIQHDNIKELTHNMRKLMDSNTNTSQEIKNLRANIGTPTNILKSIEKKIDDKMFIAPQILAPVPMELGKETLQLSDQGTTASQHSSFPGTESSIAPKPVVTLPGGILTPEERTLLMAKDEQSLIQRGMNPDIALLCSQILTNHMGRAPVMVEKLINKIRKDFSLSSLNEDKSFKNGCNVLHSALFGTASNISKP